MYEEAKEEFYRAWKHGQIGRNLDEPQELFDEIMSLLLTPEQLKEWKEGGELRVICKYQDLPEPLIGEEGETCDIVCHKVEQENMIKAGFRRVKEKNETDK